MKEYIIEEENGRLRAPEINLVQNDYNSTALKFNFAKKVNCTKKFQLKYPDNSTWEQLLDENDTVVLVGEKNGELVSVLTQAGNYEFDVAFYGEDNKITSKYTEGFYVRKDLSGDKTVLDDRIPYLDELINRTTEATNNANTALNEANNLDIDIDNSVVTITKKDGTTKSENVKGDKGDKGKDATINGKTAIEISAGDNITIEDTANGIKINSTGGGGYTPIITNSTLEFLTGSNARVEGEELIF